MLNKIKLIVKMAIKWILVLFCMSSALPAAIFGLKLIAAYNVGKL